MDPLRPNQPSNFARECCQRSPLTISVQRPENNWLPAKPALSGVQLHFIHDRPFGRSRPTDYPQTVIRTTHDRRYRVSCDSSLRHVQMHNRQSRRHRFRPKTHGGVYAYPARVYSHPVKARRVHECKMVIENGWGGECDSCARNNDCSGRPTPPTPRKGVKPSTIARSQTRPRKPTECTDSDRDARH